jgi:hypothetical protein
MSDQQLGTVVIGGSQADLAVGYYLKQHGLPFVILDQTWATLAILAGIVAFTALAFTFGTGGAPPVVNAIRTFVHTIAAFVLVAIAMRLAPATLDNRAAERGVAEGAPVRG